MRSHAGCGRMHQTLLLHVPQIFQRRKSDANKQDFEIKLNLTYQARSTPKITRVLTKVFCNFGPNLVILHSQNTASAQLPQPTRSQTGKPEENEFRPQSHLVSLSGQLLYCSGQGHSQQGGIISPLSWPAFDRAFDHLQLIRATLIFKMQKGFETKKKNCVHINLFQKKGYWYKIRMGFLRPILVKIELICEQPAMTRPTRVKGVPSPTVGCWIGWLGADAVFWIWLEHVITRTSSKWGKFWLWS